MQKTTSNGFSLIEVMVSMVISGLVISGIYAVYTIQQRTYTVQEQITEMQQKIRSAMDFMARDIRMAGYVAMDGGCSGTSILTASPTVFEFEYCDDNDDGTSDKETFRYDLYDANTDGVIDLGRQKGGLKRALAEGVDAIEFLYLDGNGDSLGTSVAAPASIRAVRVSLLVRASYPDPRYIDTNTYNPASVGEGVTTSGNWDINGDNAGSGHPANDNYHRRLLISTIKLRNMGLQ